MEHRCQSRIPTRVKVEIHDSNDFTAILGHSRDVSLDGMYVEIEEGELQSKTFVRVRIHSQETGKDGFEIGAFVIHATSHGAGLIFSGPYPQGFYGLLNQIAVLHPLLTRNLH